MGSSENGFSTGVFRILQSAAIIGLCIGDGKLAIELMSEFMGKDTGQILLGVESWIVERNTISKSSGRIDGI